MTRPVRVKICGLTREEDARLAVELGADGLGFNLWSGSKRFIEIETASAWMRDLPPLVTRVAILVNASLDEARRIATLPTIDAIQFHGDEDEEYCGRFAESGFPFIKAVRVSDAASLSGLERYSTKAILLDAQAGSAYGGTGCKIDPRLAAEAVTQFPRLQILLAGGLTPENIAEVVHQVQPYGVDVASGVEAVPGRKDSEKMRRFFAALG